MKRIALFALATTFTLGLAIPASADTLNILWYTGGVGQFGGSPDPVTAYENAILGVAANAPTAPGGNTWDVTFWDGSTAMPTGTYNVMVVASPEGFWSPGPNYAPLQTAINGGLSFDPTVNRIMLTGQDADWHVQNYPGPSNFDGPEGFLLDSINWAGSGNGMGLVALGMDGVSDGVNFGLSGYTGVDAGTDNVQIPVSEQSFPINTNLTSAGLSNWSEAAHDSFTNLNTSEWNGINLNGDVAGDYVTIVSAGSASGGITGGSSVPEPTSLIGLVGAALVGLVGLRRRQA